MLRTVPAVEDDMMIFFCYFYLLNKCILVLEEREHLIFCCSLSILKNIVFCLSEVSGWLGLQMLLFQIAGDLFLFVYLTSAAADFGG